jgi:hypothetical protein
MLGIVRSAPFQMRMKPAADTENRSASIDEPRR